MNAGIRRLAGLFCGLVLAAGCMALPAPADQLAANAAPAEIFGIDVSKYQEAIDWQAAAQGGVKFAILRCCKVIRAYDDWEIDRRFEENYAGAKAAGIAVGAYMYTDAATAAEFKDDVDYMLDVLKDKSFEFPVFLDLESASRQEHLPPSVFMPALIAGLEAIEDGGHTAGVYSSAAFYRECIDPDQLRADGYTIWEANYFNSVNGLKTHTGHDLSGEATIWQYSGCGKAAGVKTKVDCNICYTYQFYNRNAVIVNSVLPAGSLRKGSKFTMAGTVSSDAVLRNITGSVYRADDLTNPLQTVTVYPHAREYKLTGFFTKKLDFSLLQEGQYRMRITAVDSSDTEIDVADSEFAIIGEGMTVSETTPAVTDLPDAPNDPDAPGALLPGVVSGTAAPRPAKALGGSSFSVWMYRHMPLRSFLAGARRFCLFCGMERTPFYRLVTRGNRTVEAACVAAQVSAALTAQ